MVITFNQIVAAYLADSAYLAHSRQKASARDASLPALKAVIRSFTKEETNLKTFTSQLEAILQQGEDWGASGNAFMTELNKFARYHNHETNEPEKYFRELLKRLSSENIGKNIEAFYNYLLQERTRLRRAGNPNGVIVSPGCSAFIISLFACWNDPNKGTIIFYDSLLKGIHTLVIARILPRPELSKSMLGTQTIEIKKAQESREVGRLLNEIERQHPQLNLFHYWSEAFFLWVTQEFHILSSEEPTLITKDIDTSDILAATPSKSGMLKETTEIYETHSYSTEAVKIGEIPRDMLTIEHTQLIPTPEPLLTQLIQQVQQRIFIDATVIRRIYHALLAGHVILTGPPGTGKTELARIIPEILWQSEQAPTDGDTLEADSELQSKQLSTETAFTTRLVTATDDWSPRTLISGLMPYSQHGNVSYKIQFGHLTAAILKNWSFQGENPEEWSTLSLQRTRLITHSALDRSKVSTFKGQWLVIDEFNRAPIDLALGDALTALGGNDVLRVSIESGSAELPIPQDFRIIGTLNSFDRNYLNQISEALKRRFSFIEILPPTRAQRQAEQGIVLYKALHKIAHLSADIEVREDSVNWQHISVSSEPDGSYSIVWDEELTPFQPAFETAWNCFEIIRIYRQLGTAQAINLIRHMLIAGILQNYSTSTEWIGQALDSALCDTIADQIQVLLPDEIEALLLALTAPSDAFPAAYNKLLEKLTSMPQRLYGQLLALSSIHSQADQPLITDTQIEQIANQDRPEVPTSILNAIFHLKQASHPLIPQFTRRLRTYKTERGL